MQSQPIDKEKLIRKIEAWREVFFDSKSEFDHGARHAIKQVVCKAMEGEFDLAPHSPQEGEQ